MPGPDELPRLQDWVRDAPAELRRHSVNWVEQPPPLELRIGEAPTFLGGAPADGARSHWMRLPRAVGDDPVLHAALLAYASDYLLLDMAFRSHPEGAASTQFTGFSLDHALWFHRPVRFDRWHLHTQETLAISGHRGLVRGAIHDTDGHLVATAVQEVLIRPRGTGDPVMTSFEHRLFQQPWPEGEYRLFQLGFVVDDVMATAARWADVHGIGPFHVLPPVETPCTYHGTASAVEVQVAVAQAGPVQIELIQQLCDRPSVYRDLVDKGESGFHQLCTVTADYEGKIARYRELGYELVTEMVVRGQHLAYFDTVDDFGFYTEIVEEVPGFLESLDRIARDVRGVGRHRSRPHPHPRRLPHARVVRSAVVLEVPPDLRPGCALVGADPDRVTLLFVVDVLGVLHTRGERATAEVRRQRAEVEADGDRRPH